nr:MAG TPA: DNA packaging protein [Caudoviricetes sp.]
MAKLLMVSERRIQQLAKEGVIPRADRGRYELVPTVQGYIKYLQDRCSGEAVAYDYAVEKARLTKAQADLAEIEVARARQDVVGLAQIGRNLTNLFTIVRTNVRNVPGRIVSSLAGLTDERRIKALLLAEIDQALDALADTDLTIEATEDEPEDGPDGADHADGQD